MDEFKFIVSKTVSKTHPWRVELDGYEIALCADKNAAELIAETFENDNRHALFATPETHW